MIRSALVAGGFTRSNAFETVTVRCTAASPRIVATAYCQGTPLRNEIEARDAAILGEATDFAAVAVKERFGTGQISGKIQAIVITAKGGT